MAFDYEKYPEIRWE